MEKMTMIGDFLESFGEEKDERRELPQEVVDVLNDNLPSNFEYKLDRNGKYRAVPKAGKVLGGKITTQFDFNQVPKLWDKLQTIPKDKWDEYLYRTQTALPIKNAKIGDEKSLVPIEMLFADPVHSDEVRLMECMMEPSSFPKVRMTFESPEGDVVQMGFMQQAYDSVTEIKFANIDYLALKIELYLYRPLAVDVENEDGAHTSPKRQLTVTYSVNPAKASTVKEAVAALHVFRGLFNGKTKVDGKMISPNSVETQIDSGRIEDALRRWETVLKIEEKLEVSFDPGAEFPAEDVRFLTELQTCLLEGKAILWRHPFDHFHVGGFHPVKEVPFEDYIGNESIRCEFLEGPIPATLLGCEFELYSRTEMKDFVITNIEWDDESREKAEVYIADGRDKQWILTRLYMTKKQADEYKRRSETGGALGMSI